MGTRSDLNEALTVACKLRLSWALDITKQRQTDGTGVQVETTFMLGNCLIKFTRCDGQRFSSEHTLGNISPKVNEMSRPFIALLTVWVLTPLLCTGRSFASGFGEDLPGTGTRATGWGTFRRFGGMGVYTNWLVVGVVLTNREPCKLMTYIVVIKVGDWLRIITPPPLYLTSGISGS